MAYADKNTSNRPNVPGAVVPPSTSNLPTTSTTPNTPAKPNASTGGEDSAVWALAVLMLTAGCAVAAKKSHKNVSER
ncbi:MAG: hypothetical protein IIX89_00100 [Oscillospiraceae bacterium]|nr:hypothetical protein [Oscillospiraceae bacterium]